MALSRVHLTPNMDMSTLVSAINQNFQQIEGENRTKTIVGETGDREILIGRREDGSYGLSTYSSDGDEVTRMGDVGNSRSAFSIYGSDGKEQARLGEMPDGTIGVIVAKPGIDVKDLF